ncbi:hypothetical protein GYMLUDRAFT_45352 [Collybiopsis luxurians FD-317 M1]|uniref:Protein kinase domain-containing protein n=1 Tax=Collybiopsis luxurians FD-317 M1 TaxID=944289 RepID=A0A0D0BS69_9AGAR|nr:hypothetical protein GYMLUDRAFT_45352 [Collybiopsis luxurians FD-317 M1]
MPAARTSSSLSRQREANDPYRKIRIREDPNGPQIIQLKSCPHFREESSWKHGKQYRKLYLHLGKPEYLQKPPANLIPQDPRPPPLTLADLKAHRSLGYGVSGFVVYAKTRRNSHPLDRPGTVFAVKIMEKKFLRDFDTNPDEPYKKQIERSILTELPWNPFVCGLIGTFVDESNLFYALEFCPQNSLRHIILKDRLEPHIARFFYCGIVAGLAFLHDSGILHRDMKPENVFLGPGGYPVIGDFGEARRMRNDFPRLEKAEEGFRLASPHVNFDWAQVGTSLYNAPEEYTSLVKDEYLGPSIDWYASGVILYEMLVRKYPYYSANENRLAAMIKRGKIIWPDDLRVGKTVKALVASLLAVDPLERLGTYGVQEIMSHPWFMGIDWAKIQSRQYLSPYKKTYHGHADRWHDVRLPEQKHVPGLEIEQPPLELRYDPRFKWRDL